MQTLFVEIVDAGAKASKRTVGVSVFDDYIVSILPDGVAIMFIVGVYLLDDTQGK